MNENQKQALIAAMQTVRNKMDAKDKEIYDLLQQGIVVPARETPEEAINRLTDEYDASPAGQLPWVPPADESGYVEVPELSASLRNEALLEIYSKIPAPTGYKILAEQADYRLVSDPECRWHVQCISTGAWYTEASGGWCDDSQTRGQYLALVAEHFPDYVDDEEDDNEN